jgi:hypothetical protein
MIYKIAAKLNATVSKAEAATITKLLINKIRWSILQAERL